MWKVYKIIFSKPVDTELVFEFDFLHISAKKRNDLEMLYYLSREAMEKPSKNYLEDLHTQKMLVNKFIIGQILLSDVVANTIRRIIKNMAAGTKVTNEEIQQIIEEEIKRRDVLDNDKAIDAKKKVCKALSTPKTKQTGTAETSEEK
jgi:hypothetical protein